VDEATLEVVAQAALPRTYEARLVENAHQKRIVECLVKDIHGVIKTHNELQLLSNKV
jgi:hypothetical protein